MKYVVTGSLGHIGKLLTEALIKAGNDVTVITSKPEHALKIEALGAKAAVGSLDDVGFLTKTFTGADAVYTMVPTKFDAPDVKQWHEQMGENYGQAIKAGNVKYVVNLSSIGAHIPEGAGPVSGLYRTEAALNTLSDVNIKHLRPAYFYHNLLANIGLIKNMNIMGANFEVRDKKFGIAHPDDIADIAAEELMRLNFKGHTIRYIASDDVSTDEIAKTLGSEVGKPDLKWVVFSNEQSVQGMITTGLPEEIAKNLVEMGTAIHSGEMYRDYWKNHPQTLGKIKLKDFSKEFAAAYNA
jgi:uncharacterized protein YbjT (DUF2867 family)